MKEEEKTELIELLVRRGKSFEEATRLVLDHERRDELGALDVLAEKILAEEPDANGADFWESFRSRLREQREAEARRPETSGAERLAPKSSGLDRLRGSG